MVRSSLGKLSLRNPQGSQMEVPCRGADYTGPELRGKGRKKITVRDAFYTVNQSRMRRSPTLSF